MARAMSNTLTSEQNVATCLFAGDALDARTKIEHTIQESLGGRI